MNLLYNIFRITPKPILRGFFILVALVFYLTLPKKRKIAETNIKNAIGGNYKKITLKTYLYFSKMLTDIVKYLGDKDFLTKHVKIKGLENYEYAKSLNKGVIFTTAHFGNWELMVCAFAFLVEPISIIARPIDNKSANDLIEKKRTACGNKLLSSKTENSFTFIKILKKNGTLGILTDQARRKDTLKIKFFQRDARISEGAALFAYKLGTPILPAYMKENGDTFEIIIEKPIFAKKTENIEDAIKSTMQDIHRRFEEWIRREPYKYLWMHNRWK